MPANEQTWRDTKLLHKLFGVTSFLMLLATIWMFASDHNREWKPIQRAANSAEIKLTDWRKFQYASDENQKEHAQLEEQLEAARRKPVEPGLIEAFKAEVRSNNEKQDLTGIDVLVKSLQDAAGKPEAEPIRQQLLADLRKIVTEARHQEDDLLGRRKFKSADRDAAVATLGLLVRDNRSQDEQTRQQAVVDKLTHELTDLSQRYDRAKDHRTSLDQIVKQITREEDETAKALAENEAELKQLETTIDERRSTFVTWNGLLPLPGKRILELPILDAFNSPRKIDNLWSTGNTIFYNFSYVRRFDRCTTCHQMIPKTLPGSAVRPAYEHEYFVDFEIVPADLSAAEEASAEEASSEGDAADAQVAETTPEADDVPSQLDKLLGIKMATEGLLSKQDATVQFVRPTSPAAIARAQALENDQFRVDGQVIRNRLLSADAGVVDDHHVPPGLTVGDVVVAINGTPAMHANKVPANLVDTALAGRAFTITVRRGMPNPYTSHPRLDLFVGSLSPHKMSEFACTICHEGQGSATAFKWASHTPNTVRQRQDWVFNRGWFDNPHWIYPMYPERFAESSCLKCHHDVTELEPSPRFPEPPAPKVVHGYHLIRKYGCYGCHEINGFDGQRRIGPDLRLEPNTFAAALQLQTDPGYENLSDEHKDWIQQLVDHPERDNVRHDLLEVLDADAASDSPILSKDSHNRVVPLLRDIEAPGTLRKAGPSLRYAGYKLDPAFMYDWIREPKHFRPNTRMPQFFGLFKHLENSAGLDDAKQFEPLEILSISMYLQQRTQQFEYLEPPANVTEEASAERGRVLFQTRGCLACHTHKSFADADAYRNKDEIVQGPDLSAIGDKVVGDNQRKWLYSWIKEPTRYHARTVMPDLFLEPIPQDDGKVTDPVADIVAYLLEDSKTGYSPKAGTLTKADEVNPEILDKFIQINLAETFASHRAEEYVTKGVPESMRDDLKGAEVELVVSDAQRNESGFKVSTEQKLLYLGRKTIGKYGCYGCHDIPGFEDAKPIGTTLADWGRKDSARLAFEHISHYLEHQHGTAGHTPAHPASIEVPPGPGAADAPSNEASPEAAEETAQAGTANDHSAHGDLPPRSEMQAHYDNASEADQEYFIEQINAGHRAGFIYQKLKEPRSFDYHKTENKRYNERLRMPEFPFTFEEREAVITFVLGLVADPPTEKYIYRPDDRAKAILAGRQVLEKYNCGGCHMLTPETWKIAFQPDPDRYGPQPPVKTYPFVKAHFTTTELSETAKVDRSGLVRTTVQGVPVVDDQGIPIVYDEESEPLEEGIEYDPRKLELPFELWEPSAVAGNPYDVGVLPMNIRSSEIERRYPSDGGFLAKYLLPHVVAMEKQVNPAARGPEAWGWLPPPLKGEGHKVQSDWLHDFLLNPYAIRPATFLRMPRFNMSPAEATSLVNYFAAVDNAQYPYAYDSRRQSKHLSAEEQRYQQGLSQTSSPSPNDAQAGNGQAQPADGQTPAASASDEPRTRLQDAMRIVVNNNYCVKCHRVEDFEPVGSDRAKAPDLAMVYRRLRPDYLRKWIANPKSILPYTSMPVNIPYDPDLPNLGGISQDLYHGTSVDQVDGLVDLLMNFDDYAKSRTSVMDLVRQYGGPPAPGADGAAPADQPAAAAANDSAAAATPEEKPANDTAKPANDAAQPDDM